MEKWYWIIKHKEMHPKIILKDMNYWGDKKAYKNIREIELDLGDRFEYAVKFYPFDVIQTE